MLPRNLQNVIKENPSGFKAIIPMIILIAFGGFILTFAGLMILLSLISSDPRFINYPISRYLFHFGLLAFGFAFLFTGIFFRRLYKKVWIVNLILGTLFWIFMVFYLYFAYYLATDSTQDVWLFIGCFAQSLYFIPPLIVVGILIKKNRRKTLLQEKEASV